MAERKLLFFATFSRLLASSRWTRRPQGLQIESHGLIKVHMEIASNNVSGWNGLAIKFSKWQHFMWIQQEIRSYWNCSGSLDIPDGDRELFPAAVSRLMASRPLAVEPQTSAWGDKPGSFTSSPAQRHNRCHTADPRHSKLASLVSKFKQRY